jgi:hypothetical protein
LALAALLTWAVARPGTARADDVTTPLLISAGVAGGVAVIMLIAILASDKDDPDFLDAFVPMRPNRDVLPRPRTLHFGPRCRSDGGGQALLCW